MCRSLLGLSFGRHVLKEIFSSVNCLSEQGYLQGCCSGASTVPDALLHMKHP